MKIVYRGKYLTVRQWWQHMPDGTRERYEQAERPASVIVLAIDARGRVILTRERRFRESRFIWNVPAGKVEPGQTPLVAAREELAQEAGFRSDHWKRVGEEHHKSSLVAWSLYVYLARGLHRTERLAEPLETTRPVAVPLHRAYTMSIGGTMRYADVAYYLIRLWHERSRWLR